MTRTTPWTAALPTAMSRHDVERAARRLALHVSRTPVVRSDALDRLADAGVGVAGVVVNGAVEAGRYGAYHRHARPEVRPG